MKQTETDDLGLEVELELPSIYDNSLVRLRCRGRTPFEVSPGGTVFAISAGRRLPSRQALASTPTADGEHLVDAEIHGWLLERLVELRWPIADRKAAQTGMRWFPFVAAELRASLKISGAAVAAMRIALRPGLRMLWGAGRAVTAAGGEATQQHAYGADAWEYAFNWPDHFAESDEIELAFPLRRGGPEFDRMVAYPLWTFSLGIPVIALTAAIGPPNVALAVLAALLTFMLQQWASSERLTHMTLLAGIYFGAAVLAGAWAVLVEYAGLWALVSLPLPVWYAWLIHRVGRSYYTTCLPPPRVAILWAQLSAWLEHRRAADSVRLETRQIVRLVARGGPLKQTVDDGGISLQTSAGAEIRIEPSGEDSWRLVGRDDRGFRLGAPVAVSRSALASLRPAHFSRAIEEAVRAYEASQAPAAEPPARPPEPSSA